MERNKVNWQSRVRLVDEVADELRERIYSGSYVAGSKLRQEELADDLEVSRTPLREALRILESEGLLHNEPGRGVRVVAADITKILAAYEVREVLDGLAARLAAQSSDHVARGSLSALIAQQKRVLDPWLASDYTRLNVEFHLAIMHLAGNEYVSAQAPIVRMTSQVFTPVALLEVERARQAVGQHGEIATAIEAGDGGLAEQMARTHIRATIDHIIRIEKAERQSDV